MQNVLPGQVEVPAVRLGKSTWKADKLALEASRERWVGKYIVVRPIERTEVYRMQGRITGVNCIHDGYIIFKVEGVTYRPEDRTNVYGPSSALAIPLHHSHLNVVQILWYRITAWCKGSNTYKDTRDFHNEWANA